MSGSGSDAPQKLSGKISLIDQMRATHRSSEKNRTSRLNRDTSGPMRQPQAFSELPEFRRLEAQKSASGLAGVVNPFYRAHETAAGATTIMDGETLINFASYDYLSLNLNPEVLASAKAIVDDFGISASASRVVAGERPIHAALEERLANIYGVESAVCFVSGYLTNVATISCLMGPQDLVIHDELIHNSALAGIRLSGATRRLFKHNDVMDLEKVLNSVHGEFRRVMVIVEGIYSMDGDIADLPGLVDLRSRYGFWLMVDEAHALGVLGAKGRGTFEHYDIEPTQVDLWMGTLSKTACSCGGYIAGSDALITILKGESGGFVYSVGMPPVLAAAADTSLALLEREPERVASLKRNGHLFVELAQKAGLDIGLTTGYSVVPVLVGDSLRAVRLSNDLHDAGINALPIIHPAVPEGMARLRFFITAGHTPEQIAETVKVTAEKLRLLEQQNFGIASIDIEKLLKFNLQG